MRGEWARRHSSGRKGRSCPKFSLPGSREISIPLVLLGHREETREGGKEGGDWAPGNLYFWRGNLEGEKPAQKGSLNEGLGGVRNARREKSPHCAPAPAKTVGFAMTLGTELNCAGEDSLHRLRRPARSCQCFICSWMSD